MPTVSMLWEQVDPLAALSERFGLATAAGAAERVASWLAEHWGIGTATCERIVLSSQNLLAWVAAPQGRFVVKTGADEALFDRLGTVAELVAQLGDRGLPVAAPRRTTRGTARVLTDGSQRLSAMLLPAVSGDLLDAGDPDAVRAAGRALAQIHAALAELDVSLPGPEPRSAADRTVIFAAHEVGRDRAPRAAARLDAVLAELPELDAAPALIHGDVRGANILMAGDRVRAVLDFDDVARGHRVLDLAAGAVKLATRFRSWDPPPTGTSDVLLAGYQSITPLSPVEHMWFEAGVLAGGLGQIPPGADPAGWAEAVERGL